MSLILNLPPELEAELTAEASRWGVSLPDYVLRLLATAQTPVQRPRNGAELVAYWQSEGLIGTRPDITDSAEYARTRRQQAEKREWSL